MRNLKCFLWCLFATSLFFVPDSGTANDAPIRVIGGCASPAGPHGTIRMASEAVLIRLGKRSYAVDAVFHFFNAGEEQTIAVGFPRRGMGIIGEFPGVSDFIGFASWVNGRKVSVSEKRQFLDTEWRSPRWETPGLVVDTRWMVKQVTFPGQKRTTTRVQYRAPYYWQFDDRIACYIYGTGSYWKGAIGTAVFIVDGTRIGGGARLSVRVGTSHPVRKRRLAKNVLMYEFRDLEPERDATLEVFILNP